MPKFYVWDLDGGETREDEVEIESYDHESAAEEHAEELYRDGDAFETATIAVREDGSDDVKTFEVTVDYDPTFSASERTERA